MFSGSLYVASETSNLGKPSVWAFGAGDTAGLSLSDRGRRNRPVAGRYLGTLTFPSAMRQAAHGYGGSMRAGSGLKKSRCRLPGAPGPRTWEGSRDGRPPLLPLSGKRGNWEHQLYARRHLLFRNGGDRQNHRSMIL